MKVKSWRVPRGLALAVIIVGVLFAGPASAAEPEAEDYNAEDCLSRGLVCFKRSEYEEALGWFDRGLALEPDDFYLHEWKATALIGLGRPAEALESLDRALALGPDHALMALPEEDGWMLKGIAYFMLDDYAQARAAFEESIALGSGEYFFLFLYLVDRADGRTGVERLGPLLESEDDPRERDVARFLAGEIGAEDLLAKAGNNEYLLCEGHYFIGYKYKLDGDDGSARRHFKKAVATEASRSLVPILSKHELRRLDAASE